MAVNIEILRNTADADGDIGCPKGHVVLISAMSILALDVKSVFFSETNVFTSTLNLNHTATITETRK